MIKSTITHEVYKRYECAVFELYTEDKLYQRPILYICVTEMENGLNTKITLTLRYLLCIHAKFHSLCK